MTTVNGVCVTPRLLATAESAPRTEENEPRYREGRVVQTAIDENGAFEIAKQINI